MHATERTLRLIPELRNYHIANEGDLARSDTYYFQLKYDLQDDIPASFRQITFGGALRLAFSGNYTQLVMWEPLWVRLLPKHAFVVLVWRLRSLRKRPVLSFAMENNDIASLISGGKPVPRVLVKAFAWFVGVYIRFAYGRIVFASDGARANYHHLPGVARVRNTTIPNLPARVPLRTANVRVGSVVMIARMEQRKGTDVIMKAWPQVEAVSSGVRLTIVGSGPEADAVASWAADSPSTRRFLGPQAHDEVLKTVSEAAVLVSPSVRAGRWREQIGLPIHEGLLNGLTVVTTDETGLAQWLRTRGHHIVPLGDIERDLPGAILRALESPLDRASVCAELPEVDARVAADRWLMGDKR